MTRRRALAAALSLVLAPLAAGAQTASPSAAPTAAPSPSSAESAFLARIMKELPQRYGTASAATAAGYVRYSNEDRTGAISYVNTRYWDTTDPDHPAQLWYDVNDRLLGADFSIPQAESTTGPPSRFGVAPSRWIKIGAHVHYVLRNPDGTMVYGKAIGATRYGTANGADYSHPTAAGLVKTGAVSDPATVATVFLYPAIYDLPVWVVPNPLGQFAAANPNVHPSAKAGRGEEM